MSRTGGTPAERHSRQAGSGQESNSGKFKALRTPAGVAWTGIRASTTRNWARRTRRRGKSTSPSK
eukprot:11524420-Heterocapsa_arctica.AAC.1